MEDFKKPTALFSGTNIIFSVGQFFYFWKRFEENEKKMTAMQKDIETLTKQLKEYGNSDLQNEEILKKMHKDVKTIKSRADDSKLETELKLIKDALEENDISVRPKKKKKYSSESEEEPKRKLKKKVVEDEEDVIDMLRMRK